MTAGLDGELFEGVDDRSGVADHRLPRNEPGQADGYRYIKDGADDQRGDDAEGEIFLRLLALLGGRRDRVETDVSKEDNRPAGEDSRKTVRRKRVPVGWVNVAE